MGCRAAGLSSACPVPALDLTLLSAAWVLARAGVSAFETLPKVSARRQSWNLSVFWEACGVPVLCLPQLYALSHSGGRHSISRWGGEKESGFVFLLMCLGCGLASVQ